MPDQKSKGAAQGERIQEFCKLLWGKSDYGYDLEIETDDHINYQGFIRKDNSYSSGDAVMATGLCSSADKAYDELERRLVVHCEHIVSGKAMSREGALDCYGGRWGEDRAILEAYYDERDRRRGGAAKAKSK